MTSVAFEDEQHVCKHTRFFVTLVQVFVTSHYSVVLLIASMMLSSILAIFMMLLLVHRFFSWLRSRRSLVIVLYGLASVTIGIELGLVLIGCQPKIK